MPTLIELRKLAAVDMVWLGKRIVIAEYALGVILPLTLGVFSVGRSVSQHSGLFSWQTAMGIWLIGIAANYVPLLLYARSLARGGTVEEEGRPELPRARRYGVQQIMILIPLFVVGVALVQERSRGQQPLGGGTSRPTTG